MKIVMVSPHAPDRASTHAGGQFFARYVDAVATDNDVTVFCPANPGNVMAAIPDAGQVIYVGTLPRWPLDGLPGSKAVAQSIFGRHLPRRLLREYLENPKLAEVVAAADVVEIHWAQLLPLLPGLKRMNPKAVMSTLFHDVLSQSNDRILAELSSSRNRSKAHLRQALIMPSLRRVERRLANHLDLLLAFSDKDLGLLDKSGISVPGLKLSLIPDIDDPGDGECLPQAGRVLLAGALWRRENYLGAIRFIEEGWATVIREVPHARLRLVGADPPRALVEAAAMAPGVEMVGFVENLDDEFRGAAVLVAPLWLGAGVKVKVLQAFSVGLPVVGTTVSSEGIGEDFEGDMLYHLSDSPEGLALGIVKALTNPPEAALSGQRGRMWVADQPSLQATVLPMLRTYERLLASRRRSSSP